MSLITDDEVGTADQYGTAGAGVITSSAEVARSSWKPLMSHRLLGPLRVRRRTTARLPPLEQLVAGFGVEQQADRRSEECVLAQVRVCCHQLCPNFANCQLLAHGVCLDVFVEVVSRSVAEAETAQATSNAAAWKGAGGLECPEVTHVGGP
jgi:hypothetical protein